MPTYLLSVGSNIDPRRNVPRVLDRLLGIAPSLRVSRILETEPVGLLPDGDAAPDRFLNLAVALDWPGDPASLKQRLVAIERELGRDRSDPDRKRRSRPADVDILGVLEPGDAPDPRAVESYVRAAVGDLLGRSEQPPGRGAAGSRAGVALPWAGGEIGRVPVRLVRSDEGDRLEAEGPLAPVGSGGNES